MAMCCEDFRNIAISPILSFRTISVYYRFYSGNQFGLKKALVVLMQLHDIEVLMSRGCTVKSLGNRSLKRLW